jgi:putative NADH-flavin reductase
MKILLYGATGLLGQRILADAVERGHEVTAASTDPARVQELPGVTLVQGDVLDTDAVAALAAGHDAVVSAIGPGHADDPCFPCAAARSLVEAVRRSGTRLVVVGQGAGVEASQGVQPVTTLDFAATWSGAAQAEADALEVYRSAPRSVSWTYLAPSAPIGLGQQAGRISAETIASAVLRELEQPTHLRQDVTISA